MFFFLLPFFSLLFPVIPYIGPSQVDNGHPQLGAVWPQGPKKHVFRKSVRQNDIIAYIWVVQLHKWSDKSGIVHAVS